MVGVSALKLSALILGEVEERGLGGRLVPEFPEQLDSVVENELSEAALDVGTGHAKPPCPSRRYLMCGG